MKNLILPILISLIILSCGENQQNHNQDIVLITDTNLAVLENKIDTPVIEIKIEDTIPTHTFKKGETLWGLGRKYYGNRHYSSIMKIYNEIENENNIKDGTLIKIPKLTFLLKDTKLKLYPLAAKEMDQIMNARDLFMKHEKRLYALRKEQNMKDPLDMPKTMQDEIRQAVKLIDQAIVSLKSKKSGPTKDHKRMMEQLRSVSKYMKTLSNGEHDKDYGYDIDMVHQRLIHGLHNSIAWAKHIE